MATNESTCADRTDNTSRSFSDDDRADLLRIIDDLGDRIRWAAGPLGVLVTDEHLDDDVGNTVSSAVHHFGQAAEFVEQLEKLASTHRPARTARRASPQWNDEQLREGYHEAMRAADSIVVLSDAAHMEVSALVERAKALAGLMSDTAPCRSRRCRGAARVHGDSCRARLAHGHDQAHRGDHRRRPAA